MKFDLREVCHAFDLRGDYVIGVPFGTGHINDTFAVTYDQGGTLVRYIVQRLNTNIFRQPEQLMENFERVTGHIRNKIRRERTANPATRRRTLELVPAKDYLPFHRDADGNFFRCYVFVENARTYDILETEELAFEAASAFGAFQSDLADLEWRLHETIPNFHNTVSRLAALEKAAGEDRCGRLAEVAPELDFIRERAPECSELLDLQASGEITERTTHNDTKLNNVLIDDLTGTGCCVIDLDTVMPGLPHYDFGDMSGWTIALKSTVGNRCLSLRSSSSFFEFISAIWSSTDFAVFSSVGNWANDSRALIASTRQPPQEMLTRPIGIPVAFWISRPVR